MTRRTQSLEEQLLHIIDRVERGTALAGEVTQLRAGVRTLAGAQRSAGGLQAALQTERAALERVRALAVSDRFRIIGQHFLAALDGPVRQCRRCLCPADNPNCTHCNGCDVPAAVTP